MNYSKCMCRGFGPGRPMQAYLIRTQNKSEGPLEQFAMARVRGVDPKPYHSKPNPKVGVRQRDTTPREF